MVAKSNATNSRAATMRTIDFAFLAGPLASYRVARNVEHHHPRSGGPARFNAPGQEQIYLMAADVVFPSSSCYPSKDACTSYGAYRRDDEGHPISGKSIA